MNSVKGKIITRNIYLCIFVSVLYVCCQGGGLPATEADTGPGCWQGGKQGVGPHHAAGCVCVRWWGIFAHIMGGRGDVYMYCMCVCVHMCILAYI